MPEYMIYRADALQGAPTEQLRPVGKVNATDHEKAVKKAVKLTDPQDRTDRYYAIEVSAISLVRIDNDPIASSVPMPDVPLLEETGV